MLLRLTLSYIILNLAVKKSYFCKDLTGSELWCRRLGDY